jgi:hypothetical protein
LSILSVQIAPTELCNTTEGHSALDISLCFRIWHRLLRGSRKKQAVCTLLLLEPIKLLCFLFFYHDFNDAQLPSNCHPIVAIGAA